MTTPIGSSTSTAAAATSATTTQAAGQKPLDRNAFLTLLIAQMKNQDPMQPMQGTEFVAQLSQFAVVEQAQQQSTTLTQLSTQLGGIANNDATNLVGKHVTMRGHAMSFDGINPASSSVTLSGAAAKVTADVLDKDGNIVRSISLGSRPAGALNVIWDGKANDGTTAPKGDYTLRVNATDATGGPVSSTQDIGGTVARVAFDKGYPELTLDSGATGSVSDLVSVDTTTTKSAK